MKNIKFGNMCTRQCCLVFPSPQLNSVKRKVPGSVKSGNFPFLALKKQPALISQSEKNAELIQIH